MSPRRPAVPHAVPAPPRRHRASLAVLGALALTGGLAACGGEPADATVAVKATNTECAADRASVPAGVTKFSVANSGSDVNELYVLRPDG
ncbi:MAG: hypothetical protein U0Q15_14460 [Kineosporiaceae bacterium]